MFCAVAYIALYFKFSNNLLLLSLLILLKTITNNAYAVSNCRISLCTNWLLWKKVYSQSRQINIGGINILFDQSNEIFTKTVGIYIAAKRTLFNFDEVRDNIDQVLDAYYDSYNFIRNNLELLDSEKDVELYQLSVI